MGRLDINDYTPANQFFKRKKLTRTEKNLFKFAKKDSKEGERLHHFYTWLIFDFAF